MRDVRRGVVISPPPRRAWLVAGGGDGGVVGRWAAGGRGPARPGRARAGREAGRQRRSDRGRGDDQRHGKARGRRRHLSPRRTGRHAAADMAGRGPGPLPRMRGSRHQRGPGWYLTAPRVSRPLVIGLLMPNDYGFNALVCAMFVYGWLTASWPLAALERSRLEAIAVAPLPGYRATNSSRSACTMRADGQAQLVSYLVGLGCFNLGVDGKRGARSRAGPAAPAAAARLRAPSRCEPAHNARRGRP